MQRQTFWNDVGQQGATNRGVHDGGAMRNGTGFIHFGDRQTYFDFRMQFGNAIVVGTANFIDVGKYHALAFLVFQCAGHVVQTQHDVLRRHDNRLAVGWRQNIVGRHHQGAGFELCFQRQRHVYRHLVTVEVGVECRTHQRMQLNRFTFNQHRFKRLDTQTVKRWCAVQQDRMFANHFFQDVPDLCFFALNQFLGGFNGGCEATTLQFCKDERLE